MEIMKQYPDKYFDLAIVDPPYGIVSKEVNVEHEQKHNNKVKHNFKNWDNESQAKNILKNYLEFQKIKLFGVQITLLRYLPKSMGWIFWDKKIGGIFQTVNWLLRL
jgi:site-specific DNA-methyltransferase (adenine-specific)